MPVTLLAVDDSVTMRKVLEMTFAGEDDIRIVLADNAENAKRMLEKESPNVALVDVTLPGEDGYKLCRALKQANPKLPVIIMSSKLKPYDEMQGKAAGADAHIDKPYDTKKMIMLVRSVLSSEQGEAKPAPAAAPKKPSSRLNKTLIGPGAPAGGPGAPKKQIPGVSHGTQAPTAKPQPSAVRTTSDFSLRSGIPKSPHRPGAAPQKRPSQSQPMRAHAPAHPTKPQAPAQKPAPTAPQKPAPTAPQKPVAPVEPQKPTAAPVQQAVANAGADLEKKLQGLGLSQQQVDGVLALSQEVIERVVWEVVPPLAETMIKEEIARLMKE